MISNDKKKAAFYTLKVLFIANVIDYLILYIKLWYWYNNDIINFLIPVITFILYHSQCMKDSVSSLVWNALSILIWELMMTSDLLIVTHNYVCFIVVGVLIVWIIINKFISINNK